MEVNHIREFLTLFSVGNYLDAAEELYTSSASLARHIKKLEDELGFRLFVPQGRSVVPSSQAEVFRPYAEKLVRMQDQCFHALEAINTKDSYLRIGILGLENTAYALFEKASTFTIAYPEIKVSFYEGETLELLRMMQHRQLDLVFSYLTDEVKANYTCLPVANDELALYVPVSHPLAQQSVISLKDLNGLSLIPSPKHVWLFAFSHELLRQHRIDYTEEYFPTNTSMLLSMLADSDSVSLTPKRFGEYLLSQQRKQDQIRIVSLKPRIDTSAYLIVPTPELRTPLENRFYNHICKIKA